MGTPERRPAPKGFRWIFCKQYRHRGGKVLRAEDYGRTCWAFLVRVKA